MKRTVLQHIREARSQEPLRNIVCNCYSKGKSSSSTRKIMGSFLQISYYNNSCSNNSSSNSSWLSLILQLFLIIPKIPCW